MKSARLLFLLIVLTVLPGLLAGAQAESPEADTARFLEVEGSVTVCDVAGQSRMATAGDSLYSGEVIETGPDGFVRLSLDASRFIYLDKDTRVEYYREDAHLTLILHEGEVFVDVKEKLKEYESLDIQTNTLIAGIRDTLLSMSNQTETTKMCVLEGSVGVSKLDTRSITETVLQGFSLIMQDSQSGSLDTEQVGSMSPVESRSGSFMQVEPMSSEDGSALITRVIANDIDIQQRLAKSDIPVEKKEWETADNLADWDPEREWTIDDPVTIRAASATRFYDGTPLEAKNSVDIGGLQAGFKFFVKTSGSQTIPGSTSNKIESYEILNPHYDQPVTSHFTNVELIDGTLTVQKLPPVRLNKHPNHIRMLSSSRMS